MSRYARPAESIKAGYVSRDLSYLPFFIAQKKGFYSNEGISVDFVSIGRANLQLQALITGDLHFALINPDGIIVVNEKGTNLKVVAGSSNAAPYLLIGGKTYKKIHDLKGTRLGVASLNGGATSILLSYLKSKGLTASPQDVEPFNGTGQRDPLQTPFKSIPCSFIVKMRYNVNR